MSAPARAAGGQEQATNAGQGAGVVAETRRPRRARKRHRRRRRRGGRLRRRRRVGARAQPRERVAETGDLRGLRNTHELDLRRNRIARLSESCLPESLRRCFLSANPLASRDALAPLASLPRLEALALDGTPWRASAGNPGLCFPDERVGGDRGDGGFSRANYRAATASIAPHLRTLDGEDVTDEERRAALRFLVPEREATRTNESFATKIVATDSRRELDDESSRPSSSSSTAGTAPLTTHAFDRGTAPRANPARSRGRSPSGAGDASADARAGRRSDGQERNSVGF